MRLWLGTGARRVRRRCQQGTLRRGGCPSVVRRPVQINQCQVSRARSAGPGYLTGGTSGCGDAQKTNESASAEEAMRKHSRSLPAKKTLEGLQAKTAELGEKTKEACAELTRAQSGGRETRDTSRHEMDLDETDAQVHEAEAALARAKEESTATCQPERKLNWTRPSQKKIERRRIFARGARGTNSDFGVRHSSNAPCCRSRFGTPRLRPARRGKMAQECGGTENIHNLPAFRCEAWSPNMDNCGKKRNHSWLPGQYDVAARHLLLRHVRRRPLTRSQIERSGLGHRLPEAGCRAEGRLLRQRPGKANCASSGARGTSYAGGKQQHCRGLRSQRGRPIPPHLHHKSDKSETWNQWRLVATVFRCARKQATMYCSCHTRIEDPPCSEGAGNRSLHAVRRARQHVRRRDGGQDVNESGGPPKPSQRSPSDRRYGLAGQNAYY